MSDVSGEQFNGFEHNSYQESMHGLAMWSLWIIIIAGVAAGLFGFFYGLAN
ncbi:MAG: hypothetical protein ACXVDH_07010 [Nocardioides sp.]|uniref:hypothetical protein n=1 Tax=Nocardioides nematodiphilus TaxID=2849669 RepID=UPI001CD9D45C|nr:hypothetical protein [Nocardioides nematodiphilus]MCA1984185.1 hypothetical protein [Nocardioides nematodiphilus]